MWNWQKLLHVCRRWRHIILASPRRLDLRIACNPRTPTRKLLDIWPPFPISVSSSPWLRTDARGKDNVIAALERRDRVFAINLSGIPRAELDHIVATMAEPFPALTHLHVHPDYDYMKPDWDLTNIEMMATLVALPLPNRFLGGSAPHLQELDLQSISFPAWPNLVLSASHFQTLRLLNIPRSGYISPQAMINILLALPNLKSLTIRFASTETRPLQMNPPPLTRVVLPSLTNFHFCGASEYLVDFIAQIDTPLLDWLDMTFFSHAVFEIPRLYKFLDRGDGRKPFIRVEVRLCPQDVIVSLESLSGFKMDVVCKSDWPLESMTQLCGQLIPLLSQVERLEIHEDSWERMLFLDEDEEKWQEIVDDPDWLEFLNLFISVKSLYISDRLGPILLSVLEKITGERVRGVLPALQNLFIQQLWPHDEFVENTITSLVSARQLYDHPIVVQCWEMETEFR